MQNDYSDHSQSIVYDDANILALVCSLKCMLQLKTIISVQATGGKVEFNSAGSLRNLPLKFKNVNFKVHALGG